MGAARFYVFRGTNSAPPPQILAHTQSRGLLGGCGYHKHEFVEFLDQDFSFYQF